MIDLKILKQLIRLMKENDLSELDIHDKDEQVTLKRAGGVIQPVAVAAPLPAPAAAPPPPAGPAEAGPPADEPGTVKITSPMVGTFYSAPSPDVDAFVKVGTTVTSESVVCIIEAMKVFNEIKAEVSGTVTELLVKNGQAVEFGQPLYTVKTD